jgi:uncharacterized protein (DUF1697 family)
MKQYIGIIRGINVGGHNKVNMKILREALEKEAFEDVRTYIQSGNIVFRSDATSIITLEKALSEILNRKFSVDVPVIVRDEIAWKKTVKRNPFLKRSDDLTKLLVTFLSAKPSAVDVRAIEDVRFSHDEFVVDGKEVYLHCKLGAGKSDIPNTFFEKKLKVTATTRNWRTVLALAKMLG